MQTGISQQDLLEPRSSAEAGGQIGGNPGRMEELGFVAMDLDGDNLLLVQEDVESIESALGLMPVAGKPPLVGHIGYFGEWWPVVCIGSDLQPLASVPPGRRICLLLKSQERGFGVLCDGIRQLDAQNLRAQGLPACMAVKDSPLDGLAIHEGKVVGVTSANGLGGFLELWRAQGG